MDTILTDILSQVEVKYVIRDMENRRDLRPNVL